MKTKNPGKAKEPGSGRARHLGTEAAEATRDLWEKLMEYVALGTEEATRFTASAKLKVDMETLRFKKGLLFKELGKACYAAWVQDRLPGVPGAEGILHQIRGLDEEIRDLARRLAEVVSDLEEEPRKRKVGKEGDASS